MRTPKQIADDLKKNLVNFAPESDPVLKHGRTIMEQCIAEAMLEAWKAGMTRAYEVTFELSPDRQRCLILQLPEQAWAEGQEDAMREIAAARDAKTEI